MKRMVALIVATAVVFAATRLWVALVWEGILVGLVVMLLGVARLAGSAANSGAFSSHEAARIRTHLGLAPGLAMTREVPAEDPPLPGGEVLIGEIEAFLRSDHPTGD